MFVMQEFLKDLVDESSFVRFHNFKQTHDFLTGKGLAVAKESTLESSGPVVIHYKPAPFVTHLGFPDVCILPFGFGNTPFAMDFQKAANLTSATAIQPDQPCAGVMSGFCMGPKIPLMNSLKVFAYALYQLPDSKIIGATIMPGQFRAVMMS